MPKTKPKSVPIEPYYPRQLYFFLPTDLKKMLRVWPVPWKWEIDYKKFKEL